VVRPGGLELPTFWFVARRSIQLSYGRIGATATTVRCDKKLYHNSKISPWRRTQRSVQQSDNSPKSFTCHRARRSRSWEEKVGGIRTPSMDVLRSYQAWSMFLSQVAHLKRIAVCKIGRDVAVIRDGNVGAFPAQLNVVSVVLESMRKQTCSCILAPRNDSEKHPHPQRNKSSLILQMASLRW
jgi:hypothetical protein